MLQDPWSHAATTPSQPVVSRSPSSSQASKFVVRQTLVDAFYLRRLGTTLAEVAAKEDYNLRDLGDLHSMPLGEHMEHNTTNARRKS